jgi:O-antigen/teichoic acid export membrane protein
MLTVPAYIKLIGVERYGVLVIVWALLGYFGAFDLGLGRATAQRIATMRHAEPSERAEAFWTALILNMTFGVVGGLLLWTIGQYYFEGHFQVPENLRMEILAAVPWLAATVPITTLSGVLGGALQGRERFLVLNISNVLGSVLFQVLPLGVAWLHGSDLVWLVPAALLGRVTTCVVLFSQCYLHVPLNMEPSVKRNLIVPLFRYGGWVTVTSMISPFLTTLDRFIIGSIAGAKAVTYYSVPFNLASRVAALPSSLSDSLFPRFSSTPVKECNQLMDKAVGALSVILTPLIIAGMLIMEPFLRWWVGIEFAKHAAFVGEIIALGLWFNSLAYIPFARLQAQGRPDLVAKCHLAELIPYIAFLTFGLQVWGVLGAALAWSLRVTIDAILLFWICGVEPRRIMNHLPPLLLLGMVFAALVSFPIDSLHRWIIGSSTLLGSLAWAWITAPDSVKGLFEAGYQLLSRSR